MFFLPDGFDKFDAPSYSGDDVLLEQSSIMGRITPITGALKKNAKAIIAIIIIIVLAYFLYDFFIGSYRAIDFSLKNTEGESLSASSFKIFDLAGNKLFETSGSRSFSAKLKPGEYKIEAKAGPDYSVISENLSVSEASSETLEFEKNINASIKGLKENFPKALVAGQTAEFQVTVVNNGSEAQQIEFVASKELDKISLQIPAMQVGAKNSENATVTVSVPDSIKITNQELGDAIGGNIRIKYTNTKENIPADARLFPKPILKFSPSNLSISGNAGETVIKEFSITNDSPFTVYGLKLSFEITSISKNSEEEILSKIQFTEGTEFDSIGGKKTSEKKIENKIRFDIPITAKKEQMTAVIIAESPMLPSPERWDAILEIESEAQFGIALTPASKTNSVNFLESSGKYEKKSSSIRIQNTGKMDLSNIRVKTKNDSECDASWLKFKSSEIPFLAKGASETLPIEISAPLYAQNNTVMNCKIRYWYDNPIESGSQVDSEMSGWIEITAKRTA
ncbi:MAG: hypothetical protein PHD95_01995 [Candidatus ainarchaeum sp.]|nr:hypothetical protein [Candidatus ainarchaeum sp.]